MTYWKYTDLLIKFKISLSHHAYNHNLQRKIEYTEEISGRGVVHFSQLQLYPCYSMFVEAPLLVGRTISMVSVVHHQSVSHTFCIDPHYLAYLSHTNSLHKWLGRQTGVQYPLILSPCATGVMQKNGSQIKLSLKMYRSNWLIIDTSQACWDFTHWRRASLKCQGLRLIFNSRYMG